MCFTGDVANFWLAPVRMAYNYGFSETELNRIGYRSKTRRCTLEGVA